MTEADAPSVDKRFYLDDLHVGQRFLSRTYLIDAEQIKLLLANSILNPSTRMMSSPRVPCSEVWRQAGLIAASQRCAAGQTIKRTKWCKSSWQTDRASSPVISENARRNRGRPRQGVRP
jgi:hypothetical protein